MLVRFLQRLLGHKPREHATDWQPFRPLVPHRSIDGGWIGIDNGTAWRRWRDGRWEFRQDAETLDEWRDRQW